MQESAAAYLSEVLAPFGPRKGLSELVVEVNRIYHAFEATSYDDEHDEIGDQLPELWRGLLAHPGLAGTTRWTVLDFGSGTGFAAEQVLAGYGERIEHLTCFDLSPEMLARGKERLQRFAGKIDSTTTLPTTPERYNLLITNSVLHHLPDLDATLRTLEPLLTPDAWWINGHEPSARFYRNPECVANLAAFRQQRNWRKYFNPGRYIAKLKTIIAGDIFTRTAARTLEVGLFERIPTPLAINRIVDVGVAHNTVEAAAGRGLDAHALAANWVGRWHLENLRSYSFMGDAYEARLPQRWQAVAADLRQRFPADGAQYAALWRRESTRQRDP